MRKAVCVLFLLVALFSLTRDGAGSLWNVECLDDVCVARARSEKGDFAIYWKGDETGGRITHLDFPPEFAVMDMDIPVIEEYASTLCRMEPNQVSRWVCGVEILLSGNSCPVPAVMDKNTNSVESSLQPSAPRELPLK